MVIFVRAMGERDRKLSEYDIQEFNRRVSRLCHLCC